MMTFMKSFFEKVDFEKIRTRQKAGKEFNDWTLPQSLQDPYWVKLI